MSLNVFKRPRELETRGTSGSFLDSYKDKASYPFVVHRPIAPDNRKWPTFLFLHGSGSRGGTDVLEVNTLWDGLGWMLRLYYEGNRTKATTLVAEKFLTIMPLQPLSKYAFYQNKPRAHADQ